MSNGDIWAAVAAIATMLSAFTGAASAWAAFKVIKENNANHQKTQDQEKTDRENERLLTQAVVTLERAFETVSGGNSGWNVPPRSRVNWLTSARLIQDYFNVKSRISSKLHTEECKSHEAYWRHRFYVALDPLSTGFPDYFEQRHDSAIELTSAVIITDFAMWPDSDVDPIRELSDSCNADSVHLKWFHLRQILSRREPPEA